MNDPGNLSSDAQPGRAGLKRYLKPFGLLLTAAACVYVGLELRDALGSLPAYWDGWGTVLFIAGATLVYCIALHCLIPGWLLVLNSTSAARISMREGFYIASKANLLKYVPSNILGYAWRGVHLHRRGFDLTSIVWSSAVEAALLAVTAFLLAVALSGDIALSVANRVAGAPLVIAALALGAIVACGALYVLYRRARAYFDRFFSLRALKFLAVAFLFAGAFHVVAGLSGWILLHGVLDARDVPLQVIIPVVAGSWVAGFLAVGAPAGVGVREAFIILSLTALTGLDSEAAIFAALLRVSTIAGDVLFAAAPFLLRFGRDVNTPPTPDSAPRS